MPLFLGVPGDDKDEPLSRRVVKEERKNAPVCPEVEAMAELPEKDVPLETFPTRFPPT